MESPKRRRNDILASLSFAEDSRWFQKLVRDSSWLLSGNVIASIAAFIQSIILARCLGVHDFGILVLVMAYVTIINQFVDCRIFEFVTVYATQYIERKDYPKAIATIKLGYLIDALAALLGFLIAIGCAAHAARVLFADPGLAPVIMVFSVGLLFTNISNTSNALLKILNRFPVVSMLSAAYGLSTLGLTLLALSLGSGLMGLVGVLAFAIALRAVVETCVALRALRCSIGPLSAYQVSDLTGTFRPKFRFLVYTNITGFLKILTGRFDEIVLGCLLGPAAVGCFRVAKNLVSVFVRLIDPLSQAMFPGISRLWGAGKKDQLMRIVRLLSIAMGAAAVAIIGSVSLLAPWIVSLLVGNEYSQTATALQIMIWKMLWLPIFWGGSLLMVAKRTELFFRINGAAAIVSAAAVLLLTSSWGVHGTALGFITYTIVWVVGMVSTFAIHKEYLFGPEDMRGRPIRQPQDE